MEEKPKPKESTSYRTVVHHVWWRWLMDDLLQMKRNSFLHVTGIFFEGMEIRS